MTGAKFRNEVLFTFLVALVSCSIVFLGYSLKVIIEATDLEPKVDQVLYVHSQPEIVSEVRTETEVVAIEIPPRAETELSDDDMEELAKVVHNEAGNQDMIGRRLVADVVLNRVDSIMFPNTVQDVIRQEDQFKYGGTYTDEDMEAVRLECQERLDHEVLYFKTGAFHRTGQSLYQHGDHYFSGGKEK